MMRCYYNIFSLIIIFEFLAIIVAQKQNGNALSSSNGILDNPVKFLDSDRYTILNKYSSDEDEKVNIKLFYESLCPDCMEFHKYQFTPTVQKLSQYLNIFTFPYGNAQTIVDRGRITFKCQHGPAECYGNMLHACAIDYLQNITAAVIFNGCMMDPDHRGGSDDAAADMCSIQQHLDSKAIKNCAKGSRGIQLLKYYGEKSKEANFKYVPYILINDKLNDGNNFMKDICTAFSVPPPVCTEFYSK